MAKTFRGGVHPDDAKSLTENKQVEAIPLPSEIVVPVRQHIGAPSTVCVEKGQHVAKGDIIAQAGGFVSVPQHASLSGTVKAVEQRRSPLGQFVECVIIESDGEDKWADGLNTERDTDSMSPQDMLEAVKTAGIVGLGGAAFPTHVKLSPPKDKPIDTIILNGVECEPFATCDHRLMLERSGDIVSGLLYIMSILGCTNAVIGIENNKADAIKTMKDAVKGVNGISVTGLKVKYPQGGEKQLIYAVTGRKVPAGGLPMDVGCVVQNVGTAAAVYDAIKYNRPLIERNVTITGDGVQAPYNSLARLGTLFSHLIDRAEGYTVDAAKLIMGGPMMGIAQSTDDVPVVKGTSCLLVLAGEKALTDDERTCISCGRCVDVCPMSLVPSVIASFVEHKHWDSVAEYRAVDCIECGSCTYICPSKRRLVEYIKYGKSTLARMKAQKQQEQKNTQAAEK